MLTDSVMRVVQGRVAQTRTCPRT